MKLVHKLVKSHSASEEEPIDSARKEFGISIKPLPPPLSSFHSSLNQLDISEFTCNSNENSLQYGELIWLLFYVCHSTSI